MKCEDCGSEGATEGICPFMDEIYNEEVKVCLCDDCYQEHALDI